MIVAAALLLATLPLYSQVTLQADGPGNTYELISSVLGGTPLEVPDCGHAAFGRHITEEWDAALGKYVFVFHIHVTPDNDRCTNFDRQRNEIKTYGPSPAHLKGAYGEIHNYRWKFKLDAGFQPSPNFTHIFQIKAGDGTDSGAPIMTLTPRAGSPERLQLIFTPSSGGSGGGTKTQPELAAFKGQWIEASVRTLYTETGTFEIVLRRVSDGTILLSWSSSNLDMWRDNATFNRPKWGIYRSLNSTNYLRDEQVRFADFCIGENDNLCPSDVGGGYRPPTNVLWAGMSSGAWDLASSNWFNFGAGAFDLFVQGDSVLFNDAANFMTNILIGGVVNPAALTNDSSVRNYTFSGAGKISGTASIVKKGASTLTLSNANDFSGSVTVQAGTLRAGNNSALGITNGPTVVQSGATLDVNGQNLGSESVTVAGAGVGGQGAIVNRGAQATSALRFVTLSGDVTFGGTGRWDIRGGPASLLSGGQARKITKIGTNQVSLVGVSPIDAALGDIDVQEGVFAIQTSTTQLGNPTRTLTVRSGATLSFWNLNGTPLNKRVVLQGGATVWNENGNSIAVGPMILTNGNTTFNVGGTSLALSNNVVSGPGGLVKQGAGTLTLRGANTYGGETLVETGTLALAGTGSISGSERIVVSGGAALDATARGDSTLTLAIGQSLEGNGSVAGNLAGTPGSTVSPGSSIGALTVSGSVVLQGTTVMELNKAAGTNDVLSGSTVLYGGTLSLTNLGGSLQANDSFKLFNGSSYSAAFTALSPPTPAPGLQWDLSQMNASGTLRVAIAPAPVIAQAVLSGADVVISGSGGPAHGPYWVLASTNVALPIADWVPVATNAFGSDGSFEFVIAPDPDALWLYYSIQLR